jgi:hypothetical protein
VIADLQPPYYAIVLPKFHDFREKVLKGLEKVVLPILMACLVTPATVMSATRLRRDVLTIMEQVANAKARFRSLSEAIDTTSPAGRMMLQKRTIFSVWSGRPSRQSGMRGVLC